jgi:hypothetical protein
MSCCDIFFNETLFVTFNEGTEVKNVSCATGIQTAWHARLSGIHRHITFLTKLRNTTLHGFFILFQHSSTFSAQSLS